MYNENYTYLFDEFPKRHFAINDGLAIRNFVISPEKNVLLPLKPI